MKKVLQFQHKKILKKLWLYPLITLLMVSIYVYLGYSDGVTSDQREKVNMAFILLIAMFFFGIAGIINFVKGLRLFVIKENRKTFGMTKDIVAGLILNGAVISIPIYMYVDSYMHREELKRRNNAIMQIRNIKYSLEDFYAEHGFYPSESQGLSALREFDRHTLTVDPWDRPYGYRLIKSPDINGLFVPYIWSYGPDGVSGTEDDIDENTPYRIPPYYHFPAA